LEGDDYQHIVTFNEVLHAARGNGVRALTVEARDAGNVDDIVLQVESGSDRYTQVKHAVDGQTPVGTQWLTAPTRKGARSLLQRFYRSWHQLGGSSSDPYLQLISDRDIDPSDPIMRIIDRRTGLLTPMILHRSLDAARKGWSDHLAVDEAELVAFLGCLRFITGRSLSLERERAQLQLETLGLANDDGALDSGLALMREWIQGRDRTLPVDELRQTVEERIGRRRPMGGLLVVEGIDDFVAADDADVALRFVERYEDASPFERRRLKDDGDWQSVIWPQLEDAATRLRDAGHQRVMVAGAMRLPTWFGAGSALRDVLGFRVGVQQRDQLWSSDDIGESIPLMVRRENVGNGPEMAVAVGIAADPTREVRQLVSDLPRIGRLLTVSPADGPGNETIRDGRVAAAVAQQVRNLVRDELDTVAGHLHLFLATPGGLALLLGHRWNALRPTTVYEHLGVGRGYLPTFVVPA
jgi:hypothetical protein